MDLRVYYRKLKQAEEAIPDPYVIVVSHATGDGGREGQMTEVARDTAARMLVEDRARLAGSDEAEQFRAQVAEARRVAELAASRPQIAILSDSQMAALGTTLKNRQ